MSEENTTPTNEQPTTAEGKRGPRVVKHIDERIAEAREDVTKAQQKLAALEAERNNRERYENLAAGQVVNFEFGRAEKRRVVSGTIKSVHDDGKGGKVLVVESGEGLDIQINKVPATSVLFDEQAAPAADQADALQGVA